MTESASAGADNSLGTDLPPSWAVTTLGTVTDYGKTVKIEPAGIPGDAWVLELEDIEKDSSRILQRLTQSQRQSLSTKNRFDAGDVLYGKLRPYLNKVVIADAPGFCTTEIVPVQAGPALERRYLFHWLKHPAFLKYVEAASHGMNMPRLGTDAGRAAPLVLAPRPEQTRIADQLDTLLARIQACQDRLEAIPALLKRFRQAVLSAATSGSLTEGWRSIGVADWRQVQLSEVASDFSYGSAAKSAKTGEVPVLRMGNIQDGRLDWTDLVFTSNAQEIKKYELRAGDVLFNRTNSPELVGKTAVYKGERPAVYAGYLIRIKCSQALLPDYLNYCLGSRYGRDYCWSVKSDGVSQSNINAKKIAAFPFRLPPLDEQAEIVRRVEALLAIADGIEGHYRKAARQAQRLAPITLAKAFRGELVPQDLNDEPASVLLARISTQHSAPTDAASARAPRRGRPSRAPKEAATMTKSRQDDNVMGKPYLAGHLRRIGTPASAEALFKVAELPVADFYKQLAWEVAQGHVKDNQTTLEPGHAAG